MLVLPSGLTSTISSIDVYDKQVTEACPPMSVTVRLAGRPGRLTRDMIYRPKDAPTPSQDIDAMICWMTNEPLHVKQKLALKHTTRTGRPSSRTCSTASTSTRCIGTWIPNSWDSTRSGGSSYAPPCRCSATPASAILMDEATDNTAAASMINNAS